MLSKITTTILQVGFHSNKLVKKVRVEKRVNDIVNRLNKTKQELYPDLAAERETYDRGIRAAKKAEVQVGQRLGQHVSQRCSSMIAGHTSSAQKTSLLSLHGRVWFMHGRAWLSVKNTIPCRYKACTVRSYSACTNCCKAIGANCHKSAEADLSIHQSCAQEYRR